MPSTKTGFDEDVINALFRRISSLEDTVRGLTNGRKPTVPFYDHTNFPGDSIEGQIALDRHDHSAWVNGFDNVWRQLGANILSAYAVSQVGNFTGDTGMGYQRFHASSGTIENPVSDPIGCFVKMDDDKGIEIVREGGYLVTAIMHWSNYPSSIPPNRSCILGFWDDDETSLLGQYGVRELASPFDPIMHVDGIALTPDPDAVTGGMTFNDMVVAGLIPFFPHLTRDYMVIEGNQGAALTSIKIGLQAYSDRSGDETYPDNSIFDQNFGKVIVQRLTPVNAPADWVRSTDSVFFGGGGGGGGGETMFRVSMEGGVDGDAEVVGPTDIGTISYALLGAMGAFITFGEFRIDDVTIGTGGLGSSDLFADDFSSNDFSAWEFPTGALDASTGEAVITGEASFAKSLNSPDGQEPPVYIQFTFETTSAFDAGVFIKIADSSGFVFEMDYNGSGDIRINSSVVVATIAPSTPVTIKISIEAA